MASATDDMRCIPLGPLDHIAPCNIPQSIIYLGLKKGTDPKDTFSCLTEGLRRTIIQAPWLNGRVYLQSPNSPGWRPGQLEMRYKSTKNDDGCPQNFQIPLHFNELPNLTSFDELREAGFPLDAYDDKALLRTLPFNIDFDLGVDVLTAQANFVPGGCLLVLSIAPPVADGTAMLSVTKIWAEHCNGLSNDCNDKTTNGSLAKFPLTSESIDRGALDTIMAQAVDSFKSFDGVDKSPALDLRRLVGIDEFRVSSENEAQLGTGHENRQLSHMKPSLFYMPQPIYAGLRQELASTEGGVHISGNDVICAFIWKSVLRAWTAVRARRGEVPDETATLAIPFDARPHLSHLQPANYLGNFNFEQITTLPLRTLTSPETSVPLVASMIHMSAKKQTKEEKLLEAYSQLRSVPEYDSRHVQIRASRLSTKSPAVGIFSPMVLPFNGTFFGDHLFTNSGMPEAFRPMMGTCNREYRTCFVIPRKQHGGLEFVMTLSEEERDFLQDDHEFNQYACFIT